MKNNLHQLFSFDIILSWICCNPLDYFTNQDGIIPNMKTPWHSFNKLFYKIKLSLT